MEWEVRPYRLVTSSQKEGLRGPQKLDSLFPQRIKQILFAMAPERIRYGKLRRSLERGIDVCPFCIWPCDHEFHLKLEGNILTVRSNDLISKWESHLHEHDDDEKITLTAGEDVFEGWFTLLHRSEQDAYPAHQFEIYLIMGKACHNIERPGIKRWICNRYARIRYILYCHFHGWVDDEDEEEA